MKTIVRILATCGLLYSVACSEPMESESQLSTTSSTYSPINLSIATDSSTYAPEEPLVVSCTFSNRLPKPVSFLPWNTSGAYSWFELIDRKANRPKVIITGVDRVGGNLERHVITLQAGEKYKLDFKAKITRTSLTDVRDRTIKGMFLEFEDSAFILTRTGDYKIRARFDNSTYKERFGYNTNSPPHFWGVVLSDWKTFTIRP